MCHGYAILINFDNRRGSFVFGTPQVYYKMTLWCIDFHFDKTDFDHTDQYTV